LFQPKHRIALKFIIKAIPLLTLQCAFYCISLDFHGSRSDDAWNWTHCIFAVSR